MKQMYPVSVFSSGEFSRKSRKRLSGYGLIWDGVEFFGIVGEKTLHKIKKYCSLHKYRFRIENNLGRRGSDYRRRYFIMNKPVIGDKYICVYCGKLLTKDELTVDHIYPIGKASNSLKYQKKLSRKGIKNINDGKNLVSACAKCNALKSADTGLWILKAKIGRIYPLWIVRYLFRLIIIAAAVITLIYLWQQYDVGSFIKNFFQ
jgi:HNH endonuclease.